MNTGKKLCIVLLPLLLIFPFFACDPAMGDPGPELTAFLDDVKSCTPDMTSTARGLDSWTLQGDGGWFLSVDDDVQPQASRNVNRVVNTAVVYDDDTVCPAVGDVSVRLLERLGRVIRRHDDDDPLMAAHQGVPPGGSG